MSAPLNPTPDLTGKRRGGWYVVAYAGQVDGINYWQCHCCLCGIESVLAEQNVRSRKAPPPGRPCRCQEPDGALTSGSIFGLWTLVEVAWKHTELADQFDAGSPKERTVRAWKCLCACGAESVMEEQDLLSRRRLSCGCRPQEVLRAEWGSRRVRARQLFSKAMERVGRRERDSKWAPEMEKALCICQPACVVCGATDNLKTDHVRPFSAGYGLEPGNVVRLCGACNEFKYSKDLSELTPEMAGKIETAAMQFKEYWESGCPAVETRPAPLAEEPPKALDPTLIVLLRAVECGDDAAMPSLANWLEERRDPRAKAIRELSGLEAAVLSNELWQRLGLTWAPWNTLKQHLGINPMGVAATVEEIAQREGTQVQTIRLRIELALYRLTVPSQRDLRSCSQPPGK